LDNAIHAGERDRAKSGSDTGTRVVVILVTYKNGADAKACLASLERSTYRNFEVHICENGGRDAFRDLTAQFGREAVLQDAPGQRDLSRILETWRGVLPDGGQTLFLHSAAGNLGYAGAINAILSELAPDPAWSAVWILNPDTTVHPRALEAALDRAGTGRYGIVGSRLVLEETGEVQLYGGLWRRWMGRGYNIGLGAPADAAADVTAIESAMHYVSGAAMLVSRQFIESVGPMDESYFLYCEEVDWCLRRREFALGYAHESIVYHTHGTTTGASLEHGSRSELSVYLEERNKLLLTRRHFPSIYPAVLAVTFLLTAQYLSKRQVSSFKVALAGWLAGVRGEQGIPPRFRETHGAPPS
jgi:GT2 family glycosyltransferase